MKKTQLTEEQIDAIMNEPSLGLYEEARIEEMIRESKQENAIYPKAESWVKIDLDILKMATIGHVSHSKTALTAAIATVLSGRNAQAQKLNNHIAEIEDMQVDTSYAASSLVQEMYIPTGIEAYAGRKQHKKNAGFQIGSYKYRSKK